MTRHITLGNGRLHVGLDQCGQVRDLYFHYPGLENHLGDENLVHKIGVWIDGVFKWFDDPTWDIAVESDKNTMASIVTARNATFGIQIVFGDVVYNEKNIFLRKITVTNDDDRNKLIKLFFNQQFNISQTHTGDTAYFDPDDALIIHYKGRRVFGVNARCEGKPFNEYSVGMFGIEGKTGTFKDAEDGQLENNPIEHGQVDSVIGVTIEVLGNQSKNVDYWIVAAKSIEHAKKLNSEVIQRGLDEIVNSTKDYWKAWVHNQNFSFYGLSDELLSHFNKSLVQIRSHVSFNGAIIASGDSSMLQNGKDTYSYVWPRDAAFAAIALAKAGDLNASKRFFEFCNRTITKEGYFLHKYRPDYSVGSSWHPWMNDKGKQLPIQEDETALVLIALWTYFTLSKDLEFIEEIYNSLLKPAAEFMTMYRDKKTGLPLPSYDLWEEKYGVSTFTASSVYQALVSASKFARLLGKDKYAARYTRAAENMKVGIMKYLYDKESGMFYRMIRNTDSQNIDNTVDISSVFGVYRFGVLDTADPILKRAMDATIDRLRVNTEIGGIARYEGDRFMRTTDSVPGNPWFITYAWYTQYLLEFLKSEQDLPDTVKRFMWFVDHALPSGIMSEQVDASTGEAKSATPLVWSHAEYVITIINYLEKLDKLGICKACYPLHK